MIREDAPTPAELHYDAILRAIQADAARRAREFAAGKTPEGYQRRTDLHLPTEDQPF